MTVALAEQVAEIFTEVIVAPRTRTGRWRCWPGRRTSACCAAPRPREPGRAEGDRRRRAAPDRRPAPGRGRRPATWTLATGEALDAEELAELRFAWRACAR
ncbi:hypothetical protein NKH77_22825 [Streptomyces sp. M19]